MALRSEKLVSRYAKSLIETIADMGGEKDVDFVENQLRELEIISKGEAGQFFSNPVFGKDEKLAVLHAILGKSKFDERVKRFLEMLVDFKHLSLLPLILDEYENVKRSRRNEALATLRSAYPVNEDLRNRLAEVLGRVTGKTISVNVEVDKSLIGGVIAEVGGVRYDASVQGYLTRIQEEYK